MDEFEPASASEPLGRESGVGSARVGGPGPRDLPEDPLSVVSRLLADVDSAQAAELDLERDAEVQDRIQVIWGRIGIADRLAAMIGSNVKCDVVAGQQSIAAEGRLVATGRHWVELHTQTGRCLVNLGALVSVEGVGRESVEESQRTAIEKAAGWTQVLRRFAESRARLGVVTIDGHHRSGYVERVGIDHFDLSIGPMAGSGQLGVPHRVVVLSFAAISVVRPL